MGGASFDKSVEAIDKRSPVTTWHVTMTTSTSLATELPSAQPTDEWTRTPEHKSRQLDEIVTLDVVSPFIVDNSVVLEGGGLFTENCELWLCVQMHFSAPSMTVCDLSGHWIVSANTVDCEPEPDPGSRLQLDCGTCATPGTSATEYGTAGVHIELAGVGDLMPCDVTRPSPPLARSHSSARE